VLLKVRRVVDDTSSFGLRPIDGALFTRKFHLLSSIYDSQYDPAEHCDNCIGKKRVGQK